jgi:hypothetical protein
MFGASLLDEYEHCIVDMGLGWNEVAQLARNSFQHSSLPVRNRRLFCCCTVLQLPKPNIYQDRLGTKHRPTWRNRRRRFYAGE